MLDTQERLERLEMNYHCGERNDEAILRCEQSEAISYNDEIASAVFDSLAMTSGKDNLL